MKKDPRRGDKLLGAVTRPERPSPSHAPGSSNVAVHATEAAAVLIANLFAQGDRDLPGISYAVAYRLAAVHTGGDIVDVYQFNNNAVAFSIADISGKGAHAAVHAALIKYGLRAYSSLGLTPEKTIRSMDRLYLENSTFESAESFATVFLGIVDARRRVMTYSSAGHEPVMIVHPHKAPRVLAPTAPLIGVFDDQSHLFNEEHVELWPGTLFIATTDGVTEVRSASGELFGMRRLIACVEAHREEEPQALVDAILREATEFSGGVWHDDVAIIAAKFLDR